MPRAIVAFQTGYLVLVLIGAWFGDFDETRFWRLEARWPRDGGPVFLSRLATWDSAHYLYLSEVSYAKDVPSCAFYPLWPLLMRSFSVATGGNHVIAGTVLASVFSAGGLVIFFRLVSERFGDRVAWLGSAFLAAFPGSLFFHFVYSESLFFLLVMLFVFGLERRWYGLVWAAGLLLPLTRAVGIFCLFPLLWHFLHQPANLARIEPVVTAPRENPMEDLIPGKTRSLLSPILTFALVGIAPLLGYALYFSLMWHWTGNPWEGFEAQRFWNHVHSIGNLADPVKFVAGFFSPLNWHGLRGSVLDRCIFMVLVACLPVIWKLDKGWFIWALVLGIVPAMSGTFTSFTRFASVVFPMFIALAVIFSDRRLRWARYGLLSLFAVLHVILVWRFVNFRWAG